MINISNLSFGYSPKRLLYKQLSLSLRDGRIYGLLGKNGAGKSTLLKNIAGTLFPLQGDIVVNERIPQKRQPSFLRNIYYIPEEVYVPAITVARYLDLFSVFYPNFNREEFNAYLNHLEVVVNGKLTSLSFGQQKKFIIAFALACNTKVLLMDEPTNGLDIPSKGQFRKLIASVMDEYRIILISTHQTRDLENLIDELVIIDNGKLLVHSSMENITRKFLFETVGIVPEKSKVLYSEQQLKGVSVVTDNILEQDSKINLEHFFNGVTANPGLAQEILSNN